MSSTEGEEAFRHKTPTEFARHLRRNLTVPERLMWSRLRNRQLGGFKFVRQEPIADFVVDFVCREPRVVIELDGDSHNGRGPSDTLRQTILERAGYRVLRVSNDDVLRDLDAVLEGIAVFVADANQSRLEE